MEYIESLEEDINKEGLKEYNYRIICEGIQKPTERIYAKDEKDAERQLNKRCDEVYGSYAYDRIYY